ncbi:CMRF35-like molecule 5 [Sorex araneus]|uniref:CMRF35-like molecule 5 n=1 Tax=Sorex araneus TaxID=42254 RepID=UPI002433692D|nr:CMRF35-like molecule 5 [Sorex araneus]
MRPLALLFLCSLSGSTALRGPREVVGQAGSSLNVTCQYEAQYKSSRKWWCREADLGACQNSVEISKEKLVVRKDRVTIREDRSGGRFTVTMEQLRDDDDDTYWCGIDRPGPDLRFPVTVTISPANTGPTSMATFSRNVPPGLDSPEENADSPNKTHHPSKARALLSSVHFLLLVFLKVPLFLVMMGAVVWASWPQRGPRKRTENRQSQSIEGPQKLGCQEEPGSPSCSAQSPLPETLPIHS